MPSETDVTIAHNYEEIWDKINLAVPAYIIVSLQDPARPDIRAYWIRNRQVSPTEFQPV